MEKYSRVLIIIFFLCIFNLALSFFIISKINSKPTEKPVTEVVNTSYVKASPSATPKTPATSDNDIKSDLVIIKAEIRALRESIDASGLVITTPKP